MVNEVIAGRYEIRELVGSGGMSSVYLAHDRLLERNVALKILHDELGRDDGYVDRFRKEARSVAQLSHPNIVNVIDRGEQDGRQFIVFEYVDGENLKDLIEREGPLPVRDAVEIALQVGRALGFAHRQGLVHRDVKPHNVLLDDIGRARVTDFGIARSIDVESGTTTAGAIFGTSHYIAPEQARSEGADEKTDVYSLGAVLYELLTAEVPYPGDNFVAVAMRHVNDPVPSARAKRRDVPERLAAAVRRALAKVPAERFASMDEFCAELEACLDELHAEAGATAIIAPGTRKPGGPPPALRQRRERSRRPLIVVPLVVLALGGAAAAAYFSIDRSDGNSQAKPGRQLVPVRLRATTAYDPEGGDGEHDNEASRATDGDPRSYWTTEQYTSGLGKSGVGLVLDARKPVRLARLSLSSDTPGFRAEIRAGSRADGPFERMIVPNREYFRENTARARPNAPPFEYYVIWITDLGDNAAVHIDEITRASEAKS